MSELDWAKMALEVGGLAAGGLVAVGGFAWKWGTKIEGKADRSMCEECRRSASAQFDSFRQECLMELSRKASLDQLEKQAAASAETASNIAVLQTQVAAFAEMLREIRADVRHILNRSQE